MRFSALVLRNIRQPVGAVGYDRIADALLSGGVLLSELVLTAYDDPASIRTALARLGKENDGVVVICDGVLLSAAREAVSSVAALPADGLLSEGDGCLFALVSADEEGERTVRETLVPAIDKRRGQSFHRVVIKTVGAPAEEVLRAVEAAGERSGVFLHTGEKYGVGKIEVVYNSDASKVAVDETVRLLATALEPYVYAMEDITPGQRLFQALKLHRMHVATAESFTGGGVGREIVKNPGASSVFYEGLNTYDSASKQARLGVSEYTLKAKGAVSGDTAYEMAAGLLKEGHCDVAIATTGIAGPSSDRSGIPAGTCFIAVGTCERVRVCEFHLTGSREAVTEQAINLALFLAYKEIR